MERRRIGKAVEVSFDLTITGETDAQILNKVEKALSWLDPKNFQAKVSTVVTVRAVEVEPKS